MTEAAPRKRIVVWVLLGLSVLAAGLAVCDAAVAMGNPAPAFLFRWLLPRAVLGAPRLVALAAQLALPGLAVGLPVLAAIGALATRTPGAPVKAPVIAGLTLAVVGLGANLATHRFLNAASDGNAENAEGIHGSLPAPQPDAPRVLPRGVDKIVFASNREGNPWKFDLYAMNPDGSGQERLSKAERYHMQPRFSPDRTQLTFTSTREGKAVVCLFDWATREEKEVCEGMQSSFTPDGKGLVFKRGGRGSGQVWHRDLATGKERRLSPGLYARCAYPSASPDGTLLAFANNPEMSYKIYLIPFRGGAPRLLAGDKGACDPRWSPTGRWLSYQTETHIFMIQPDGAEKFQVTVGGGVQHYAAWSPDEKTMAYCQGPGPNGPWQIWGVSLEEDEDPVQLTTEGSNMYPDWGRVPVSEENE